MPLSSTYTFTNSNAYSYNTSLVEVASNVLRLLDLGGATYSTSNPVTTTQAKLIFSDLTSISVSSSTPAGTAVKLNFDIGGSYYWYNTGTSMWESSDGTYTQSNTPAEIASSIANIISNLALDTPVYIAPRVFLHSTGSARPTVTNIVLNGDFTNLTPANISTCYLYGYVKDLLGSVPYDSTKPITFYVSASKAFFHTGRLVTPFTKSASFNSLGFASLSVIETATPGEKLEFSISFYESNSRKVLKLKNAIVPNSPTSLFSDLTTVDPLNYG